MEKHFVYMQKKDQKYKSGIVKGKRKDMSTFSQLLSQYIEEKEIQVYGLARYCGYDRANMYKIIKGKRNPPGRNFVEKVAEYMHLLLAERECLYEAYEISVVGYDNYYRRKAVMKFLTEISGGILFSVAPSIGIEMEVQIPEENLIPLEGSHNLRAGLLYILAEETRQKNGHIRMLMQPDTDFVVSILAMCSNSSFQTKIDHIFCLEDAKGKIGKEKNHSLTCLKNILPLYNYNYEYHTWYYYGSAPVQNEMFSLFPYIVLTSKYACVLTVDMKKGFLTGNTEMIKMLSLIFENCLSHTKRFAHLADQVENQIAFIKTTFSDQISGYCFQMTPCVMPVLTQELLEKYVKKNLPDRTVLLEHLREYIEELSSQNLIHICSLDGILKFLEDGDISEIPSELYDIPEWSGRVEIVRRMFQTEYAKGLRVLKKSMGSLDAQTYMYITPECGTLRIPVFSKRIINLWIQEPGMVFAFFDFCENLEPELFYTLEEARELVERRICEIQDEREKA